MRRIPKIIPLQSICTIYPYPENVFVILLYIDKLRDLPHYYGDITDDFSMRQDMKPTFLSWMKSEEDPNRRESRLPNGMCIRKNGLTRDERDQVFLGVFQRNETIESIGHAMDRPNHMIRRGLLQQCLNIRASFLEEQNDL